MLDGLTSLVLKFIVGTMQALQLVADVHSLADQVRHKCGYKDAERSLSGTLTPHFSSIQENDNQVSASQHWQMQEA